VTIPCEEVKRDEGKRDEGTPNSPTPNSPTPSSSLRVLVVDDSSINCEVLEALLLRCGVSHVRTAENGREALEILKRDSSVNMVLTDLWMPEMDGYGLLREIRADEKLSGLPVFLLTADVSVRNEAESNGFNGVLMKPVTLESIRKLLS